MDSFPAFLEMSSATNEVAILRRGMLNTFDTMLNIEIETPADANSKGPFQHKFKSQAVKWGKKMEKRQKHVRSGLEYYIPDRKLKAKKCRTLNDS